MDLNKYVIDGTISHKDQEKQITESFKKREFAIKSDEQFPQEVLFEMTQGNCSLLDNYNFGDKVRVSFSLKGKKWTSNTGEDRYFNTLSAWKIEKLG